jgi:hypothetical protein
MFRPPDINHGGAFLSSGGGSALLQLLFYINYLTLLISRQGAFS